MDDTTRNASEAMDSVAAETAWTVSRAMTVRNLTKSQAVALVAKETGTTVDFVDACVDRVALILGWQR